MIFPPRPRPAPPEIKAAPGIPRVLHQIWLGPAPLPPEDAAWAAGLRALHPAWGYRLWTDADLPGLWAFDPFGLRAAFDLAHNYGYQSDLLRLLILWLYGGVYLDTDCEGLAPLDPLLVGCDAFLGATFQPQPHEGIYIENAVMGAAPRHPFLSQVLTKLAAQSASWPARGAPLAAGTPKTGLGTLDTVYLTGPGMLSAALDEYRRAPGVNGAGLSCPLALLSDVAVIPPRYLYAHLPDWGMAPAAQTGPSEARIRHHWGGKWFQDEWQGDGTQNGSAGPGYAAAE